MEFSILEKKINHFKEILDNTKNYRKIWDNELRDKIITTLETIVKGVDLKAQVDIHDQFDGLETVSLLMGMEESGIAERLDDNVEKKLIRSNGSLMFQQLFNGKISIWINYPYIEGVGEPRPPKMVEILRPHELQEINILRFTESFIEELTTWEDFDDDKPPVVGIGYNHAGIKPIEK